MTIHLLTGGTYVPREGEVAEVREIDPEAYRREQWNRIERKLATLKDPVDLYLEGAERSFELGLRKQGLEVLERILSLGTEESEQIPLLFVPQADEELLRDWRVAAGQASPALPEVASASGAGGRDGHAAAEPGAGGEPERSVAGQSAGPSEPVATADPVELVRAAQMVAEAQMLYQSAARSEGKEEELSRAKEKLEQALEILEPQPQDDETVKRLRRQIGQLLSDVARVSPF